MARRSSSAEVPPTSSSYAFRRGLLWFFSFLGIVTCFFLIILVYTTVEQFLVSSDRFALLAAAESSQASSFRVSGTHNISHQQIRNVFVTDFGRSVYLCPIAERRRRLMGIDWVQNASVSRVWPNQIAVTVEERRPVAFVQIRAVDGTMLFGLIDRDGVILNPQGTTSLNLPILTGIPARDPEPVRRQRVEQFLRLSKEIGRYMNEVSEVDVSDLENLKIIQPFNGRTVTLLLGNQSYKSKLDKFSANIDDIRQRIPDVKVLDLRLKGRITAIGGHALE